MPLVMLLAACVDPTPLEHALAPPTFLSLPVALSAAALNGDETPCAEVVEGCPDTDSCAVRVVVTFGEACPFPVGVATGTAVVWGRNGYGSLEVRVDLSEVRVDGRVPLVREVDCCVWADTDQRGGWQLSLPADAVTWVEQTEHEPNVDGDPRDAGQHGWDVVVARSGSTTFDGWIHMADGDVFGLNNITWEPTCVQNPVSGEATRFDHSLLLGQHKQYEVSFHADCDGRVDVDGRTMAIDLLR